MLRRGSFQVFLYEREAGAAYEKGLSHERGSFTGDAVFEHSKKICKKNRNQ